jgi:hypothetical protein
MAKKNKATVAKRLKLEAYRQGISLSELKRRQKLEEIGGIGNDASILLVTHSMASESAGFAAKIVPACESETPVLCNRSGNEASFSSVTQHNWTNGTSDSAWFAAEAILACATQVLHNISGNLASISLVSRPHHTNHMSDSGFVTDAVLACATPVLHERFGKSDNTDCTASNSNSAGFAVPAHEIEMSVLSNRSGNEASFSSVTQHNRTNATSNSAWFAADAIPACATPVLCNMSGNLASISLVTRLHHTSHMSNSGSNLTQQQEPQYFNGCSKLA